MTAVQEQLIEKLEQYFLVLEASQKHETAARVIELARLLVDVAVYHEVRAHLSTFLSELAVQSKAKTNGQGR
jgi:hypothetical protein